jgi:hypothetical protein
MYIHMQYMHIQVSSFQGAELPPDGAKTGQMRADAQDRANTTAPSPSELPINLDSDAFMRFLKDALGVEDEGMQRARDDDWEGELVWERVKCMCVYMHVCVCV